MFHKQFLLYFKFIFNQVRATLQILSRFKLTWLGLLISNDDYGLHVALSIKSDLAKSGRGCLAYLEALPKRNVLDLKRIDGIMKKSTSRGLIVFAYENHTLNLMEEVRYFLKTSKTVGFLKIKVTSENMLN